MTPRVSLFGTGLKAKRRHSGAGNRPQRPYVTPAFSWRSFMKAFVVRAALALCAALTLAFSMTAAQTVDLASSLANDAAPDREKRLIDGARREGAVSLYTSLVVE